MNDLLPILAIETSDNICSACVYFSDEKYYSVKVSQKHSHSEKIFEIIESVISQSEIQKSDLKLIAISAGPGSFTGLRIGMAAAKGIAQALAIPMISVPTFEALALQIAQFAQENSSFIIANKVGKDEVYYAKFYIKSNNYIFQEELKIVPNLQLSDFFQDSKVFGNLDDGNHKSIEVSKLSAPDAEYVAMWANRFGKEINFSEIDFIEPNYLKDFVVKEKKI